MPYFKKAIILDANLSNKQTPYIRWKNYEGSGMFTLQGYCTALMMQDDYYKALDCFHNLEMDGTGIYITEIYEKINISAEDYLTQERRENQIKDFQINLVNELLDS
jgi:hypothetical protein